MAKSKTSAQPEILGNTSLSTFDVCIIGSGPGGSSAAWALTTAGKNVLVLEAGFNPWPGLGESDEPPLPQHSNDEIKYESRGWDDPGELLQPRTFRMSAAVDAAMNDDVNVMPQMIGGGWSHADMKSPRFNKVDFQLATTFAQTVGANPGLMIPGWNDGPGGTPTANFADWPFTYDELAPFYYEAECLYGVQGSTSDNPFASTRFGLDYPMPPGLGMYFNLVLADGARNTTFLGEGLHPHTYPTCINSRFRDNRPPCVDCGPCSGSGCPNNSKGSPAVTALLHALRTDRCQVRVNCRVVALVNDGGHVTAVEYIDGEGVRQSVTADAFMLAAGPIESARLCFLSGPTPGTALGNSSDQVGRNLMFHLQNNVNGFLPQRVHGQRGRAVTHGISDFRGVEPGGEALRVFTVDGVSRVFLGGICELSASQGRPITEDGETYAISLPGSLGTRFGLALKNALRDGALGQHLMGLLQQAEDAPQLSNRIDLDPTVRDVFGLPVPRVTYAYHAYEKESRKFYVPIMREVVANAGTTVQFVAPCDLTLGGAPTSRHVLGTLRMGTNPGASVTRPDGRFYDVDNLYACDGSVFVTSSGYNPTLTLIAVSLKIAHGIAGTQPGTPGC